MPPQRRTALAALCCGSAAALAGLPTLDLYLDLRMTVRGPADALEAIAAQPDGLILWESAAAPDWGDELEGLDVIDEIKNVPTTNKAGHGDVPAEPIVIESVKKAD